MMAYNISIYLKLLSESRMFQLNAYPHSLQAAQSLTGYSQAGGWGGGSISRRLTLVAIAK